MPAAATQAEEETLAAHDWTPACEIRIYTFYRDTHEIISLGEPCGKPAAYHITLHSIENCAETGERFSCAGCVHEEGWGDRCDRCGSPTVLAIHPLRHTT